jgi:hypothetical protein
MRKYHHIGIPTAAPNPGEVFFEPFGIYCTDREINL